MGHRTVIPGSFAKRGAAQITANLVDRDGTALGSGTISTLTLTLYDLRSGNIINSKDGADISASLSVGGALTLDLDALDMVVTDDNQKKERHVALVEWAWAGTKEGNEEIEFTVVNQEKVT